MRKATIFGLVFLGGCAPITEVELVPTEMCLKAPYRDFVTTLSAVDEATKMGFLSNIQMTERSNAFSLFEEADSIKLYWNRYSPRICPESKRTRHCINIATLPMCDA